MEQQVLSLELVLGLGLAVEPLEVVEDQLEGHLVVTLIEPVLPSLVLMEPVVQPNNHVVQPQAQEETGEKTLIFITGIVMGKQVPVTERLEVPLLVHGLNQY